jgi:type I restriction enzyme S subunit
MEQVLPKIRFPEFNENWDKKKLGEISQLITKGTTPKKFINEGIKFIKLECFEGDKINGDKCLFIDENTHNKELKRSILKENDLLFAIAGATIGKVNFVTNEILPANTNQALSIIRLKEEECKNYIYQILKSDRMKRYITDSISVGAQPNLNLEQMNNFTFFYPTTVEQSKIAKFLTTVDEKLQTLKQKKTLLEQYKKGVMQKIFSQELRFKDDNGNEYLDWEEKKLGDTLNITVDNRGKTPPTLEHGIPLLEVNSIGNKNIKYNAVSKFVSELTFETWFRKHLKKGDVLFSTVGNTALCSYYDGNIKACIAQNIVGLRFNTDIGLFMYYLLIEDRNNNKFKQIEMGAVQPSVKVSQMIDIFFEIPSIPEQNKIANFLSTIDNKINHCQEQIVNTEVWKKGLLQQMFV